MWAWSERNCCRIGSHDTGPEPTYQHPPGVGVKCPDDEINEQRTLKAPAITLSDHRAVYDAKCRGPQRRGGDNADTCGQWGSFFADVLYGRPLCAFHGRPNWFEKHTDIQWRAEGGADGATAPGIHPEGHPRGQFSLKM